MVITELKVDFRSTHSPASPKPEALAKRHVLLYDGAGISSEMDHDPSVAEASPDVGARRRPAGRAAATGVQQRREVGDRLPGPAHLPSARRRVHLVPMVVAACRGDLPVDLAVDFMGAPAHRRGAGHVAMVDLPRRPAPGRLIERLRAGPRRTQPAVGVGNPKGRPCPRLANLSAPAAGSAAGATTYDRGRSATTSSRRTTGCRAASTTRT